MTKLGHCCFYGFKFVAKESQLTFRIVKRGATSLNQSQTLFFGVGWGVRLTTQERFLLKFFYQNNKEILKVFVLAFSRLKFLLLQ